MPIVVTGPGSIYCVPFLPSVIISSTATVKYSTMLRTAKITGNFSNFLMRFDNLLPVVDYKLYCYTEYIDGRGMSLEVVKNSSITFRTGGEKFIKYDIQRTLFLTGQVAYVIPFLLSSIPETPTVFTTTLTPCLMTQNYIQVPNMTPDRFSYSGNEIDVTNSFTLSSQYVGCFNVSTLLFFSLL